MRKANTNNYFIAPLIVQCIDECIACSIYRKQQILRGTKQSRFSRIFDKTRKFYLVISMARSNMYCNLTKPQQFSLHSAKKPVNRESFVPWRICCLRYYTVTVLLEYSDLIIGIVKHFLLLWWHFSGNYSGIAGWRLIFVCT